MGKRRSGRELAFRLIFQMDVGGGTPAEVFEVAREASDASSEVWLFAVQIARGAWDKRGEIDPIIVRFASGWTLERIANADRNLLRMALYEILFRPEIPQSVSVNEAVELAKEYSTAESSRFVNGILGAFLRERGREADEAKTQAQSETLAADSIAADAGEVEAPDAGEVEAGVPSAATTPRDDGNEAAA